MFKVLQQNENNAPEVSMTDIKDISSEYKKLASRVLQELEKTLGKDLDDSEKFMFVHGTAECKLPQKPEQDFGEKSAEKCIEAKQQAQVALNGNDLLLALSHLNRAVMLAPTEERNLHLLAESLFLRSKTLFQLGYHDLALRQKFLF